VTIKKKVLITVTVLITILFVGILFAVINAFTGNPISAAIATSKIKAYVQEMYPNEDLEIPKATYSFKLEEYYSIVASKTSKDTVFAVIWRNGRIVDQYDSEVGSRFTTYQRLQKEFDTAVEQVIAQGYPYETSFVYADYNKNNGEYSSLSLDMPLDLQHPPLQTTLSVYMNVDQVSYELLSERLVELHQLMIKSKIPISVYSIGLLKKLPDDVKPGSTGEDIYVFDYPADQINSEHLVEMLKKHREQREGQSKGKQG